MLASYLLDDVVSGVARDLRDIGSTMVVDDTLDPSLASTIEDILRLTMERVSDVSKPRPIVPSVRYAVTPEFAGIAVAQAEAQRHPAEPLMAAEVIFDVALPSLAKAFPDVDPVKLAQVLHNEIWRRFPPGAIAYVEFILSKLAHAGREERFVIARELHDRVGHRLALALQRIEFAAVNQAPADSHLRIAAEEVRASLLDVQDIAIALRPMVGGRSLREAIEELIERLPENPEITIEASGDAHVLLDSVAEELFTIVLEATRNARRHARARSINISLAWERTVLRMVVHDDGVGFSIEETTASGLRSMSERAQAIGARLLVAASATGTSIEVELPLGRVTKRSE